MSKCTVATAIERIKVATQESPIVVYKHKEHGFLECFFLTAVTKRMLKNQIPVGVYSNDMMLNYVSKELSQAANG